MSKNRISSFIKTALTAIVAVFAAFLLTGTEAYAAGNSGDEFYVGSDGCARGTVKNFYTDSCFGATWRMYPATSDSIPITYQDGKKTVTVGTVTGCLSTGYYYRLAYEEFKGNQGAYYSLGKQQGLLRVNQIRSLGGGNGYHNFLGAVSTNPTNQAIGWDEAYSKWQLADKGGVTHGIAWKDTSWFCYSPDWEGANSSYDAWSWVDDLSTASKGPDEEVEKTIYTKEDQVTVNFKHQLSYNAPNAAADTTFGPANTTWHVEVRQDSVWIGGTNEAQFSPANTGPTRTSIWEGMPYMGESSYTIKVPENDGESTRVCSIIAYDPKNIAWKQGRNEKDYVMDTANSNTWARSSACVTIIRDDPQPEKELAGRVVFWSVSKVESVANGTDIKSHSVQAPRDENDREADKYGITTATLKLSTDEKTAQAKFTHKLKYLVEGENGEEAEPFGSKDRFADDVATDYIRTQYDEKTTNEGTWTAIRKNATGLKTSGEFNINPTTTATINFGDERDKTVKICENTTYTPKYLYLEREEVTKTVPIYNASSIDIGQGVYVMTPTDDAGQANGVLDSQDGPMGIFRPASSSDYYHYEPRWKQEDGYGYWEDVEVAGGRAGFSIYSRSGATLYTPAFVSADPPHNSGGYYAYTDTKVNWGTHDGWTNEWWISYITSTGVYHWSGFNETTWEDIYSPGPDSSGYGVSAKGNALMVKATAEIHDYWIYHVVREEGNGGSEVCIEVTRPPLMELEGSPDTPESYIGAATADGSAGPMYAGETSSMSWTKYAKAYPTRRIMEWRAIAAQIAVDQQFNETNLTQLSGNITSTAKSYQDYGKSNEDPCYYFQSVRHLTFRNGRCVKLPSPAVSKDYENGKPTNSDEIFIDQAKGQKASVITPDEVGDKYCATSGYRWQYWWGQQYNNDPDEWAYDGIEYWTNYSLACSPIAKKPSLSSVNGGIFSNSDVSTSLATRYDYEPFGVTSASSNTLFTGSSIMDMTSGQNHYGFSTFGSWSDYLATIGRSAGKLGSGASLAWIGSNSQSLMTNSPLTIQNFTSPLGYSQITSSSTVMTRLRSYFSGDNATDNTSHIGSGWENLTDSHIIYSGGDLTIDGNITLQDKTVSSVYDIPQVVIFADGNINIGKDVERIDAWLIATGTIDSCANSGWDEHTAARVNGYNNQDGNSPVVCENQLIVNGPIFAQNITTHRSYGASKGLSSTDPADYIFTEDSRANSGEVFNLSADSYLWAYAQAGRLDSSYTEAYSRELPPRY